MRKLSLTLLSEYVMFSFPMVQPALLKTAFNLNRDALNICEMLQPNDGPSLPLLFICDSLFQLPLRGKGGVGKCLPPPLSGERGGAINKGNSWSSSTLTEADTLKLACSLMLQYMLKAHEESMESSLC